MNLSVTLSTNGEPCDKCGKPMTAEQPGVQIWQSTRMDRNVILVQVKELQKAISKAEQSKEQAA